MRRAGAIHPILLLAGHAPPDLGRDNSHTLFLDGLYAFPDAPVGGKPVFHPTPAPTDEDVARVDAAVCRRVERKLRGREATAAQRRFEEGAPVWCALAGASAGGVVATGPRRGRYVIRVRGAPADVDAFVTGRLCAEVAGFNLQAATRIAANDRKGLERMARYLARPPIATDRLSRLDDGRLGLRLKRPWRDGTTSFVFTPHELVERLVALVPRPRAHLTRYFGVFAPAARSEAWLSTKAPWKSISGRRYVSRDKAPRRCGDRPPPPRGPSSRFMASHGRSRSRPSRATRPHFSSTRSTSGSPGRRPRSILACSRPG